MLMASRYESRKRATVNRLSIIANSSPVSNKSGCFKKKGRKTVTSHHILSFRVRPTNSYSIDFRATVGIICRTVLTLKYIPPISLKR